MAISSSKQWSIAEADRQNFPPPPIFSRIRSEIRSHSLLTDVTHLGQDAKLNQKGDPISFTQTPASCDWQSCFPQPGRACKCQLWKAVLPHIRKTDARPEEGLARMQLPWQRYQTKTGHEDAWGYGATLLQRQRVGVVEAEEKAPGRPYYGLPVPKVGLQESWRKTFWKGR